MNSSLKQTIQVLAALGLFLISYSGSFAQATGEQSDVVVGKLDNGFSYYLLPEEAPGKICVRILANTGSNAEKPNEHGLAHLLEHMIFKGSKNFPGEKSVEAMELMGLRFGREYNASTKKSETNYYFYIPSDDPAKLKKLLSLLKDWFFDLRMEEQSFEAEKKVVIAEIGNGGGTLNPYLTGTILEGHNGLGTVEELEAAQFDLIQDFYKQYYTTPQLALLIQGDLDKIEVQKHIKQIFGSVQKTAQPPSNKYPVPSKETIISGKYEAGRLDKNPLLVLAYKMAETPISDDFQSFKRDVIRGVFSDIVENRLISAAGPIHKETSFQGMELITGTYMYNLRLEGNSGVRYRDLLERFTLVIDQLKRDGVSDSEIEFFFNRRFDNLLERSGNPTFGWNDAKEHFLSGTPIASNEQKIQWMNQIHEDLLEVDFVGMFTDMLKLEKTIFFDSAKEAFDERFTDEYILATLNAKPTLSLEPYEFSPPQKKFMVNRISDPIQPKMEEKNPSKILQKDILGKDLYQLKYPNGANVIVYNSPFASPEIKLLGKGGLDRIPLEDRSAFGLAFDYLGGNYGMYSAQEVDKMERSLGIRRKSTVSNFEFEVSFQGKNEYLKEMIQVFYQVLAEAKIPEVKEIEKRYITLSKKAKNSEDEYEVFRSRLNASFIPTTEVPVFSEELMSRLFTYYKELIGDISNSVIYVGGDLPENVDDLISSTIGNLPADNSQKSLLGQEEKQISQSADFSNEYEFMFNRNMPLVDHFYRNERKSLSFQDELVNEGISLFGYSKIYEILRRKHGLVYTMGTTSFVSNYPKFFNSLSFRFMVDSSNLERSIHVMQQEVLAPMSKGEITSDDLVKIKGMLQSSYLLNFYDTELLTGEYLRWYLRYGKAISIQELNDSIEKISKKDVNQQLKDLLRPEHRIKILRFPKP